jgi:ribosomal protein S18 acetylase RimI-like enzyme
LIILNDTNFSIRKVKEFDLPALEWDGDYTHYRRLYRDLYDHSMFGETVLWIAEMVVNGVVGQIFEQLISSRMELADGKTRGYLFAFRVKNHYRNLGIGTSLIAHAEKDLIKRGYAYSVLNVAQNNKTAREYYERIGYQVVGNEEGRWSYIDNRGILQQVTEPSWRMEKLLGQI